MLGRYSEFSWQVTNNDPDSLQFELHYGGGEKDKGVARYYSYQTSLTISQIATFALECDKDIGKSVKKVKV